MQEIKFITRAIKCDIDELTDSERELVEKAKAMTRTSLATYSHFHVGAAIMLENGEIVTGSNQENAAYPSGTCAERTAAYYASARYPGVKMTTIAIAAWSKQTDADRESSCHADYEEHFISNPISPCGACRQALLEYEKLYGPIKVILYGKQYCYVFESVASLLPYCFTEFP